VVLSIELLAFGLYRSHCSEVRNEAKDGMGKAGRIGKRDWASRIAILINYAEAENLRIIAEYVEAETGKGANRVTVARWASIRGQKHPAVMRIQEAFARERAIGAR